MFLTFKKKIITDINNKKFKNIYFFMGEERFLIENLTKSIELFLKKQEKIKKKILYGSDLDLKKNLIIVKEAQLIICYNNKVIDKRKKLYKYIKKNGIIFNCVK